MKKLMKGLMTLIAAMSITTSAHADWLEHVALNSVDYINYQEDGIRLVLTGSNKCGGTGVWIPISSPLYSQAFVLFNIVLPEQELQFHMSCNGDTAVPDLITVYP